MERRALIQWMVATGGLATFARLSPHDLEAIGVAAHRRVRDTRGTAAILTPDELRTVTGVAECIIPRTATPGATDAGVSAFMETMLAEWYPAADVARYLDVVAGFLAETVTR